jgi:hypothetical protein
MKCKEILEEIEFVETRIAKGDGDTIFLHEKLNKLMELCTRFMCIECDTAEYVKVYRGPFTRRGAIGLKNYLVDKGIDIKIKHRSNQEYDIYAKKQD